MRPNTSTADTPRVPTFKWALRVGYKLSNLDGWNAAFLDNRPDQLKAGIDVYKVVWKRRKSSRGQYAYKATIHARVVDKARAEAFMREARWSLLARSPTCEIDMPSITNDWHPLRG